MGDEIAFGVDDIGIHAGPGLNAVQYVRQKFQLDRGDGDASRLAGEGHGDLHGRPMTGEGHRAEPCRRRVGVEKGGGVRKVLFRIGGEAGAAHLQDLAALSVKLGNLRHSRRVLEDQRIIGAALRERHRASARCPVNLAFDLGHELLDALGGVIRLFHLRAQQLGLAVAVGEPHLGGAAEGQDGNDQSDEGNDIFAEQASSAKPP